MWDVLFFWNCSITQGHDPYTLIQSNSPSLALSKIELGTYLLCVQVLQVKLFSRIEIIVLRNDETIISSISVTDIFFDVYLGKWNYRAIPKVKTWSYFLTIP